MNESSNWYRIFFLCVKLTINHVPYSKILPNMKLTWLFYKRLFYSKFVSLPTAIFWLSCNIRSRKGPNQYWTKLFMSSETCFRPIKSNCWKHKAILQFISQPSNKGNATIWICHCRNYFSVLWWFASIMLFLSWFCKSKRNFMSSFSFIGGGKLLNNFFSIKTKGWLSWLGYFRCFQMRSGFHKGEMCFD